MSANACLLKPIRCQSQVAPVLPGLPGLPGLEVELQLELELELRLRLKGLLHNLNHTEMLMTSLHIKSLSNTTLIQQATE